MAAPNNHCGCLGPMCDAELFLHNKLMAFAQKCRTCEKSLQITDGGIFTYLLHLLFSCSVSRSLPWCRHFDVYELFIC